MLLADDTYNIASDAIRKDWQPLVDKGLLYVEMQIVERAKKGEFSLFLVDSGTDNCKVNTLIWDQLRERGFNVWHEGYPYPNKNRNMSVSWAKKQKELCLI